MPSQTAGEYRRSWIFRDETLLRDQAHPLQQYRDVVAIGDTVYLWRGSSARDQRIERWGVVRDVLPTTPIQEGETPSEQTADSRAVLDVREELDTPISRESLLRVPGLRGLTILRNPSGTNFRVTPTEAVLLNQEIRERGGKGPSDPEGAATGAFPAEALTDYRFSGTPTRIFATALHLLQSSGAPRLEAADLFSLSLELAATYPDRTGISRTLRGMLGKEPLERVTELRHAYGIESLRRHTGPLPWQEAGSFSAPGATVSAGVLRVVDRARQLAIATTTREQIRFRHFVAALIVDDDSDVQERIQASGFEPGPLREHFLEGVLGQFQDDRKAWERVLGFGGTPRPPARPAPKPAAKPARSAPAKRAAPAPGSAGPPAAEAQEGLEPFEDLAPPAGEGGGAGGGTGDAAPAVEAEPEVGAEPPPETLDEPGAPGAPGPPGPPGAADATGSVDDELDAEPGSVEDVLADLLVPFLADRPEGRDLLGLEDEYRAFAKLIVGTETKLPMAIGLFGHWGTGKSFFMGKLREEIAVLAEVPREQYCHHVAQVEFNAWHYMEADIWASFADHIFRELERKTRESEDAAQREKEQERFEALLDQLETWSALKESSARKLDLAKERVKKARAKIDHANRRQVRAERVTAARREQLLEMVKDGSLFEHLSRVFGAARDAFGLKPLDEADAAIRGAKTTLAEARDVLKGTRELGAEVEKVASHFDAGRAALDRWPSLLVLSAAAVVLGLVLAQWNDVLAGAVGVTTEGLALLGIAQSWMRGRTARAATFVKELKDLREEFRGRVDEARKQAGSPELGRVQDKLSRTELKLERVSSQLDGAREEHAEATRRVTDLEAELAGSTPAERIVQFVRERASSEAYRGRLGTLALVRRDFERLSDLLGQQARGERMVDRAGKQLRLPEIDRVVLYIDDLDRIPWEKVVQVLQAVHLLLAFPLFVVVVAVDARWVRESVEHHLRALSHDRERGPDAEESGVEDPRARPRPTPLRPGEFLEKIIQVPFWLRPLTRNTTHALIDGLIEQNGNGRAAADPEGTEERAPAAAGGPSEEHVDDGGLPEDASSAAAEGGARAADDEPGGPASDAAVEDEAGEPAATSIASNDPDAEDADLSAHDATDDEPDLAPLGVPDVRNAEQAFMKQLAPIVGKTPRVVKRFVNLYLILRAFRPETGDEAFVTPRGEYRAVLLLLAILTGQARFAPHVFHWLESGASVDTLGEWVSLIDGPNGPDDRDARISGGGNPLGDLLFDLVKDGHEDIRMEHLNRWLLRVSRFGFEQPRGLA